MEGGAGWAGWTGWTGLALNKTLSGVLLFPRQVVPISDRKRLPEGVTEGGGRGGMSGPGGLVASLLLFISVFAS